jgi:uncharacterized membrane protein
MPIMISRHAKLAFSLYYSPMVQEARRAVGQFGAMGLTVYPAERLIRSGIYRHEGAAYVTVFAGPESENRAREYFDALRLGQLKIIQANPRH